MTPELTLNSIVVLQIEETEEARTVNVSTYNGHGGNMDSNEIIDTLMTVLAHECSIEADDIDGLLNLLSSEDESFILSALVSEAEDAE